MTQDEIYAKTYQLLVDTVDPLENRGYYIYITPASLLTVTSAYHHTYSQVSLDHLQSLLRKIIDHAHTEWGQLLLTSDQDSITLWPPRAFPEIIGDYKWDVSNKALFIGTGAKV